MIKPLQEKILNSGYNYVECFILDALIRAADSLYETEHQDADLLLFEYFTRKYEK